MPQQEIIEPEKPFENWSILNLEQENDRERLAQLLLPERGLSITAYSVLDYLLKPPEGNELPLCRSVLIEDTYFDQDFINSISSFYSKGFRNVDRICIRLHFFSRKIELSHIIDLEQYQDSYLGFCVIRPLQRKALGRIVLKPRREKPEEGFPICSGHFYVNIAGTKLFVDSAPLMEQDGRVQTCSSVAIWVSTTTMAHYFDLPDYTTSEIMDKATKFLAGTRVGPTQGLTHDQIMLALKDMGYDPIMFGPMEKLAAIHTIYSYIESGIPPILTLEFPDKTFHAITALGHTHKRPLRTPVLRLGREPLRYFRSSEWIPSFYIHDDQRGIFRELEFIDPDSTQLRQRIHSAYNDTSFPTDITVDLENWRTPVSLNLDLPPTEIPREVIANLWTVIVPLPRGITLSHLEAGEKCISIMRLCVSSYDLEVPEDLVVRTYLTRSNDYKARMKPDSDINDYVRILYRSKPMPKWLWVTELSTVSKMNVTHIDDLRIIGELIIDATSNPWPNTDFIAFHWINENDEEGMVVTMSLDDKDIDSALLTWSSGPDEPYRPLLR